MDRTLKPWTYRLAVSAAWLLLPIIVLERLYGDICLFRLVTDIPCPFCGFSRGLIAMSHGDWREAMCNSPLAGISYIGAAGMFIISLLGLILRRKTSSDRFKAVNPGWIVAVMIFLLFANWFYRLSRGLV